MLRFELLGGFQVVARGRPAGRMLTARQQQLLAYLALHRAAPVPRQQIAGRFWPDSTDAQSLTNLRRELHHLRHALPEVEPILVIGSRTLAWKTANAFDLDVVEFEHAVDEGLRGERALLERAVALYRGDLLPDCDDEWIRPERERLQRRFGESLVALIAKLEDDRALGDAIDYAQRLLDVDPLNETTWRTLMRCHGKRGERATALHVYQQCASVLKRELGVQPGPETRLVYRELLEDAESEAAPPPPPPRTLTYPLVGRQTEWTALVQTWQAAASGQGRMLILRGEAGIGKTRLAEELIDWATAKRLRSATTRCFAGEGRLAYAPIAAWLRAPSMQHALRGLDAVWLSEIARLYPQLLQGRQDVAPPEAHLESWQRPRFFEALAHAFASASPLLLVVDDLQWCDSDTLEWLHFFFRWSVGLRVLVVGTVRSEEESDNPALSVLVRDLARLERLSVLSVGRLDEQATGRLAEAVAERSLEGRDLARVFRQTEGHPLFIVETGRMDFVSGDAPADTLPPRVQAVVAARLVQLSPDARSVAEAAAVVGRDFTFSVLAHVSDLEEDPIVRALDELWQRQVIRVQEGDRWDFSHDRIREVAYDRIGPARRRLLHRRVAQALEQLFAAGLDEVSASIAAHFEQAGQLARAIHHFERAAAVAVRVSANEEAIRCLGRALALVEQMPEDRDRVQQELRLRSALQGPLTAARGYAATDVEANLVRVAALAAMGRGRVPVQWLWSLWTLRFVQGDLRSAEALSSDALALAEDDPSSTCEAHHALAATLMSMGRLEDSHRHFEVAIAAYDEERPQRSALGSDLGVFSHAWHGHALWLLGRSDQAGAHAERAITLADRLNHPYNRALAHAYASLTHQLRGDVPSVRRSAETAIALCDRHGFAYYGDWARILLGWADCQEQRLSEGIRLMEEGLDNLVRQRALARRPYYLSLLSGAYTTSGRRDRAVELVDEALALTESHNDVWWSAELCRLKGELLPDLAEASFRRALETAGAQGSRALELRAAISLGRLLRGRGDEELALGLLAPLVAAATTANPQDLSQAEALLAS